MRMSFTRIDLEQFTTPVYSVPMQQAKYSRLEFYKDCSFQNQISNNHDKLIITSARQSHSNPSNHPTMEESYEIVYQGWLIKSPPEKVTQFLNAVANTMMKWKSRYFTLKLLSEDRPVLEYFTDETLAKSKGFIDLAECSQIDAGISMKSASKKFTHVFDIRTQDKIYYLVADSDSIMNAWVDALCKVCGLKMWSQSVEQNHIPTHSSHVGSTRSNQAMAHLDMTVTNLVPGIGLFGTSNRILEQRYSPGPGSASSGQDSHQNSSNSRSRLLANSNPSKSAHDVAQQNSQPLSNMQSPQVPFISSANHVLQEMNSPNEIDFTNFGGRINPAASTSTNDFHYIKPVNTPLSLIDCIKPNMNNNTIITSYATIIGSGSSNFQDSPSTSRSAVPPPPPPPPPPPIASEGASMGKSGPYIHISDCHTGKPANENNASNDSSGSPPTGSSNINHYPNDKSADQCDILSSKPPPPTINRGLKPQRKSKDLENVHTNSNQLSQDPHPVKMEPLQLQPPPGINRMKRLNLTRKPDERYDLPPPIPSGSLSERRQEKYRRNVIAADELYDIPRTGCDVSPRGRPNSSPVPGISDGNGLLDQSVPPPDDSHSIKPSKHSYTNAPAGFMENKDTVFIYDNKPSLPIMDMKELDQTAPPISPLTPNSSGSRTAINDSVDLPEPPPKINRELKPRKKNGEDEALNLISSNSSLIIPPSSPSYYQDIDIAKRVSKLSINKPFSRNPSVPNKDRIRPVHYHTRASSYSEETSKHNQNFLTPRQRKPAKLPEVQYLDLDLDSDSKESASPRSPTEQVPQNLVADSLNTMMNSSPPAPGPPGGAHYSNAPTQATVYKTVDFVKTKAFNEMRNNRNETKQNPNSTDNA